MGGSLRRVMAHWDSSLLGALPVNLEWAITFILPFPPFSAPWDAVTFVHVYWLLSSLQICGKFNEPKKKTQPANKIKRTFLFISRGLGLNHLSGCRGSQSSREGIETSRLSHCDTPRPTRPHLLILPKHSTNWEPNLQLYEPAVRGGCPHSHHHTSVHSNIVHRAKGWRKTKCPSMMQG